MHATSTPLALLAFGASLAACAPEPEETTTLPEHPCANDVAAVEVAPPQGAFGDLVDGGTLWCGNPPQGGAPYTPFRLRLAGPEALADGVTVEMSAYDPDGVELAYTDLTYGVTCANVGESEGYWVGAEAHMRYEGSTVEDLEGQVATVTISATSLTDATVHAEVAATVTLVR